MKNYRRILAVVLTVILSICLFALPVMAATQTANGLELTLVTDKAEYAEKEQIKASLTVKNTTDAPISGLVIEHRIPKGIEVVSGKAVDLIDALGAGESSTLDVVLTAGLPPKTGDFGIAAVAAAMVLSGIGLVFLSKDAKVRKGAFSVFLCCVMVAGLLAVVPVRAQAEDLTVSTVVKVDGKDVTLSASVKQMAPGTYSFIDIAEMTNGKVTADKYIYTPGETVTLTVKPDTGYSQKLTINGEPLLLGWKTNTYTFTATESLYEIAGSFEKSLNMAPADEVRWDSANQAHGIVSTNYSVDDAWWFDIKGEYSAISVKAKNYLSVEDSKDGNGNIGYSFVLRITMDNGKFYAFRIINDKGTYAHDRYGAAGAATGWGSWKNIHNLADAINGDGVDYKLERTGDNILTLTVNGVVMETYTMEGVTAENKVVSVGMRHYGNKGEHIEIPFQLTVPGEEPPVVEPPVVEPPVDEDAVEIQIPTLENGTVTTDKESYKLGDTVTLTIAPAAGYFQKLYIDGEPLLLDWKSKTYSFVAEKESYEITGSFEPSLEMYAGDWGRWDNGNHAHGILSTRYPNNNDSWWTKIKGEYTSISINAKNYLPIDQSYEGIAVGGGWRVMLYMQLDNGNYYAFSMWIDTDKRYAYNHYGGNIEGVASTTGWGGAWCLLTEKNTEATAALNGDGAEFKLERIDGNHIQITLGGTVLETYTIPGVTEANKVISVGMQHNGNKDQLIEIPFQLTAPGQEPPVVEPPADEDAVEIQIPTLENGTITADKTSYKVGDTVKLTITPAAGYFQKLYINGEPLMLKWKTFTYEFVATEKTYTITGSFGRGLNLAPRDWGRWDDHNQLHDVLNTYYPNNNDAWWMAINGDYKSLTVKAKNYLPIQETVDNFMVYLQVTMDNGRVFTFRVYTDPNGSYAYNRAGIQNAGDASADWGNWRNLSHLNDAISGEGVDFKVERTAGNILTLSVNGEVVDTYTMSGVTADNKVASVGIKHQGNKGEYVEIPFELG